MDHVPVLVKAVFYGPITPAPLREEVVAMFTALLRPTPLTPGAEALVKWAAAVEEKVEAAQAKAIEKALPMLEERVRAIVVEFAQGVLTFEEIAAKQKDAITRQRAHQLYGQGIASLQALVGDVRTPIIRDELLAFIEDLGRQPRNDFQKSMLFQIWEHDRLTLSLENKTLASGAEAFRTAFARLRVSFSDFEAATLTLATPKLSDVPPDKLRVRLDDLNLSSRPLNAMRRAGVVDVDGLLHVIASGPVPGMGLASWRELLEALLKLDIDPTRIGLAASMARRMNGE